MRGPDFHKREAKRSLWDLDGQHEEKKHRKTGRARLQDKKLIEAELDPEQKEIDAWIALDKEADEAMYCHDYGPCERCLAKNEEDK